MLLFVNEKRSVVFNVNSLAWNDVLKAVYSDLLFLKCTVIFAIVGQESRCYSRRNAKKNNALRMWYTVYKSINLFIMLLFHCMKPILDLREIFEFE